MVQRFSYRVKNMGSYHKSVQNISMMYLWSKHVMFYVWQRRLAFVISGNDKSTWPAQRAQEPLLLREISLKWIILDG